MKTLPTKIKGIGIVIALISYSVFLYAQTEFTQHVVTTNFTKGADVIAVDLDQDGYQDIVATNTHTVAQIAWWKNDGSNTFNKIIVRDNLGKCRSVRAADINNDQETDLVAAVYAENRIIYLENDGNESFIEYTVDSNFVGAHTIDIKDVNDDGHLDILCSGFDYQFHNGEIAWWENDGQHPIGWTKHLVSNRFQQSPFVYGEDMDNDGDLDMIACGELNNEILWWENDGNEYFTEHMVDSLINGIHTVIARDVDLDGDMDILGAACIGSRAVWYENDGSQDFIKHDLGYFAGALWLDAADLDNDGYNDLFGAPQGGNQLAWWENPGNEQFTKRLFTSPFTQSFCVVPVMMDADDDLDLVAIGWQSNTISWFENTLESINRLHQPESVEFDAQRSRYLVSNWEDGNIIEIDSNGKQQYFTKLPDQLAGLHIVDDILYAASSHGSLTGLLGFKLSTGELYCRVEIDGKVLLNDVSSDNDGYIYITDCEADKIFKVRPEDSTYTTFVASGLNYPNGIYFDEPNNRLLVLNGLLPYRPIVAVSLEDSTTSVVVETGIGSIDGLTADNEGNFYFSSWETDCIYKYDENFTNPPEVVSSGHNNPADIFYNKVDEVLAVPNFYGDTLELLPMGTTDIEEWPDMTGKVKVFPNPFKHLVHIEYDLSDACFVELSIYNLTGQCVAILLQNKLPQGKYTFEWNQSNDSFSGLQSGIYFCKFRAGNVDSTIKLIKID